MWPLKWNRFVASWLSNDFLLELIWECMHALLLLKSICVLTCERFINLWPSLPVSHLPKETRLAMTFWVHFRHTRLICDFSIRRTNPTGHRESLETSSHTNLKIINGGSRILAEGVSLVSSTVRSNILIPKILCGICEKLGQPFRCSK